MPGSCTSMPKRCLPMTVSGMSMRLTDLPISFQSLGSFSFTSFGGSSLEAASATFPKLTFRLLRPCVMKLADAEHSDAGTPHCCAAAAISISRAVAPARRKYSCELRMVRLPTAAISPQARLRFTFAFAEAYSIDRKSTRLNSSHLGISYAVFCLKKKKKQKEVKHTVNSGISRPLVCVHRLRTP